MLGIAIAALISCYNLFIQNTDVGSSFHEGASFLYSWYWFWGVVNIVIVIALMGLVTFLTTGAGHLLAEKNRKMSKLAGSLLGFGTGATLSLVLIARAFVAQALSIGGAWLLLTAGQPGQPFESFDRNHLIGGVLLLVVKILFQFTSRQSKSSTDRETNYATTG